MLRAVELRFAGYFVAGFGLDVVAAGGGAGFGWHGLRGFLEAVLVVWKREMGCLCRVIFG